MTDRVALVTGAGSDAGIGFAVAERLARDGMQVFLTSTTERCLARAAGLRSMGFAAAAAPADLTRAHDVDALLDHVRATFGDALVVVNNAGMTSVGDPMRPSTATHATAPGEWMHVVERNLLPTYLVARAVLPAMRSNGFGRIVNIASTTGVTGAMAGEGAYGAAKAAVVGFTRTLALEYARDGITANAVAPGWIATASQTDDEHRQGRATPLGRSGSAGEVAHVVAMLCAPDASYITGQCIVVDGGNSVAEERA